MTETRVTKLLQEHYAIDGQLTAYASYDDEIFRVDSGPTSYILKIYHPEHNVGALEMQIKLMEMLDNRLPQFEIPAAIKDRFGDAIPSFEGRKMTLHPFLSGRLMGKANPILPATRFSLGAMLGSFQKALDKTRLTGDEYTLTWDNAQVDWIEEKIEDLGDHKSLIQPFLSQYKAAKAEIQQLRKSIIHNDANEQNVFVQINDQQQYVVTGAIDFGDSIYTQSIHDVAIGCAYAMMGVPNPLEAAVDVIRGYHEVWPLQEAELKHLFTLIGVRLINSLAHSTLSYLERPDNEYILLHSAPTIKLLEALHQIDANYAHYYFRAACGYTPVVQTQKIVDWIRTQTFHTVFDKEITSENSTVWDLSVGSTFLGSLERTKDTPRFSRDLFGLLEDENKWVGIGRYDEIRLLYTEASFAHETNNGPSWRTLHLGIDVFARAGQPVYAPLGGKVIIAAQNALPKDYGQVIVLEHLIDDGTPFYTLYGHLSSSSLAATRVGDFIEKGQSFAWLGTHDENGDWVPHLHFQVMTDLLGNTSNFPGVADPNERSLWLSICPDPNLILGIDGLNLQAYSIIEPGNLSRKRKEILPHNLSVSFSDDPLHILRGRGVYLYDHLAHAYLDTVNNVAHVGHENWEVVQAGRGQMEVLNTNTRYLHGVILKYGEALLRTLPDHLEVIYFCNSGSEANDLAMRLARNYTNASAMVVLEQGYHGHTANCINVSSYKFDSPGGEGLQQDVIKLPMPDTFRGRYREDNHSQFAHEASHLISSIDVPVAGFIGEAILSCGGQIVPPPEYFNSVYKAIRGRGGICIADEVQTGFGRVGDAFWAFELHDIDPDVVTMGKPIGNGHPLAAVATTRAIAEAFDNGMEYFNTYGGNPVSCAIGYAVLKYVQDHDLANHARTIGEYLVDGLKALQKDYSCIGDVRGHGLFLGVELVQDPITRMPSKFKADYIVQRMKDYHIQMSTDGPDHNVIKIKPPLVFQKEHADLVLTTLKMILSEDYMKL